MTCDECSYETKSIWFLGLVCLCILLIVACSLILGYANNLKAKNLEYLRSMEYQDGRINELGDEVKELRKYKGISESCTAKLKKCVSAYAAQGKRCNECCEVFNATEEDA